MALTKKELIAKAKALGVSGVSKMSKDDLLDAIAASESLAHPAPSPAAPDLGKARAAMNLAAKRLSDAERRLESARSINTLEHRTEAVAAALDVVAKARSEAAETYDAFHRLQAAAKPTSHR